MAGPGPWVGGMWGFWWIFPLIGVVICFVFMLAMMRMMSGGGRFMCMGPRREESEEIARLRQEVADLRDQVNRHGATR